jgi:hypothetical protein
MSTTGKQKIYLGAEIVRKDDFIYSYDSEIKAGQALRVLDDHQVFPLTYMNPKLIVLNILGLNTYFTGSLKKAGKTYAASITGRHAGKDIEALADSSLGLKLDRRADVRTEHSQDSLYFSTNGAYYARLLSLMGWPSENGRKASNGTELPMYLTRIIDMYDELGIPTQRYVKKFVSDLVRIWLVCKSRTSTKCPSITSHFMSQPSEEQVILQGKQLVKATNIVYPQVQLSADDINTEYDPREGNWSGNVYFTIEKIIQFPRRSPFSVRTSINEDVMLSTDHPTTRM